MTAVMNATKPPSAPLMARNEFISGSPLIATCFVLLSAPQRCQKVLEVEVERLRRGSLVDLRASCHVIDRVEDELGVAYAARVVRVGCGGESERGDLGQAQFVEVTPLLERLNGEVPP